MDIDTNMMVMIFSFNPVSHMRFFFLHEILVHLHEKKKKTISLY